jgi:hypothetical protein
MTVPVPEFDRSRLRLLSLRDRVNRASIERDQVKPGDAPGRADEPFCQAVVEAADRIRQARQAGRPVIAAFGAHSVKNGLGPVFIRLMEKGWLTHLATNGAGIIHDWEYAFQGETSEDVKANVANGTFGLWQETGFHINLALLLGARDGLGYGESIGRLIARGGHDVPRQAPLLSEIAHAPDGHAAAAKAAGAADLLSALTRTGIPQGWLAVPHPFKKYSIQAAAYRLGIPFTGHPMIGHDIIYTHPLSCGAAIGRTAERDFLRFAHGVSQLEGGVYLSIGSAVMSPMIFEKSLSMARNTALRAGRTLERFYLMVVDLAESTWDWSQGEPPMESPAYYQRYNKTFSRMGGTLRYLGADNRDFLTALALNLGEGASA